MSTTPTPTTPGPAPMRDVIDAMRTIQTEGDLWHLAEALKRMVPKGSSGFAEILDKATAEGVAGKLTAQTLRLYRDTANRWPASKRVPNVSFTAHREAMPIIESHGVESAAKVLTDIRTNEGKVTVASVRRAVAVKQGKNLPTTKATSPAAANAKVKDVLADLMAGGPQLAAAITGSTPESDLDKLHAGLGKVLSHVERLRSKAARKSAAAKKPAPAKAQASPKAQAAPAAAAPTPTNGAPTPAAPAKRAAGDLRGL